ATSATLETSGTIDINGLFTANDSTITITGNGDFDVDGQANFAYGTSTVDLKGTGTIIGHSNWISFYKLTCGYPTKITSIDTGAEWNGIDIYNTLTVGAGQLIQKVGGTANQKILLYAATVANGGTIDVEEFEVNAGTSSSNGGNFADTWMQVVNAGTLNLTGSVTASGNWRVGHYTDNKTNVLNLNGFDIVSSGYFDVGAYSGTNIVGHLTCGTGSITIGSDMHIYSHQNGADTTSANLGSGTHIIPNELHVTGTNASLTLSSATTTVGGNFTNEGTIIANGGEVIFNDKDKTSTISGSTTFFNLTCTTGLKTLYFTNAGVTEISNNLNFSGTDGNKITLAVFDDDETVDLYQWPIYPQNTWTVDYVSVSDSINLNALPILPTNSLPDGGNNTNWYTQAAMVNLISFDAIGYFGKVKLFWVTGSELDNLGFNILRSEDGKNYIKINPELIKGLGTPVRGQAYTYEDSGVVDGKTYYYLLEDIETTGKTTRHGPVAAHPGRDSDSDGMTDDWEYHYGLEPFDPSDANIDSDDDGLTNLEEFLAGTNPLVIDSQDAVGASETGGVKVIESAGLRTVLELDTTTLKVTSRNVDGVIYHVITLPEYTHGQTTDVGKPQIPTKGILLGALSKKPVTINILESEKETYPGYNIYPVPKAALTEDPNDPAIKRLTYEFYKDTNAYSIDAFYPGVLAEADYSNYLQDQQVIKVIFYPIQFNPVKGTLEFYKKIKLEVLQEGADLTTTASTVTPKTAVPLTAENTYKIYINENGIYRLTESYLESQEISLSNVDPRKLSIYNQGAEIPIYAFGEEDGIFDESDYVEFYAQAMDTRYTGTNVYWLVLSDEPGLRMAASGQVEDAATTPGSFLETYRKEDTTLYWMEAVGEDRWFIDSIYGSQIYNLTLNLDGVANASDEATVKIGLESSVYSGEAFMHHLYARLNGYPIADASWQGAEEYIINSKISQSYLNEGANTVTLEVGEDPTGYEEILVNWVEVSYLRNFTAKENALTFGNYTGGAYKYQISGFTNQDVEIYDITDPKGVQRITQFTVLPEGAAFAASFKDIGSKEYVVLTQDKAKLPSGLLRDEPSNLADKENKADYIIITHPDFYDTVLPFAEYRSANGLKVKVVKLDDIYDEFNYGIADVSALKDFLKYAYNNWTEPKPTYVLLVGDATYDYRDYSGYGFTNYVPTYLVQSLNFGETGSDNWFVCFDGDSDVIADMLIGRFPVKTTDELKSMIDKIIAYEAIRPDEAWTEKVLLVADNDEKIFTDTSEKLASYLTESYTADKQYLGTTTNNPAALKQNIINSINEGRLFVNYAGHGGIGLWANERLFTWDDINSLYNQHTLPIFITLTCADGYFVYPRYIESLGERLINYANGGAIATFVPSGISYPTTHAYLAQGFYGAYFKDNDAILGSMVARGKLSVYENESDVDAVNVIQTFNLFGDPALRVRMKAPQITAVDAPEVFNLEKGKVNEIFKLTKEPEAAESTEPDEPAESTEPDEPDEPAESAESAESTKAVEPAESAESAGSSTVIVDNKVKDTKKGLTKIIRVEEEAAPTSPSATKDSLEDKVINNKELGIEDIQLEDKTVALAPPKWKILSKSTPESLQVVKPSVKIDYGAVEENVTNISKDAKQLAELRAKFDEAIKAADLQKATSILRVIAKLARKIYWRTF
ncbi:MAG: hypothetical protein AMJ78_06915, partial [Omnitrophica WOR_2 bacterium SM23_29]